MSFFLGSFLFLVGLFCVFLYHFHYLIVLLGIESMLLASFFFLSVFVLSSSSVWIVMVFLMVLVCMGAFGLALLIFFSRGWGGDFIDSFSV